MYWTWLFGLEEPRVVCLPRSATTKVDGQELEREENAELGFQFFTQSPIATEHSRSSVVLV